MDKKMCDCCHKIIDLDKSKGVRIIIYEKVKDRVDKKGNYIGHSKLDLCLNCLIKLGYKERCKVNKPKKIIQITSV